MSATDRARRLDFIASFGGRRALLKLVEDMIIESGADFLTDEQIEMLTEHQVQSERSRVHRNIANRKISAEART